MPYPPHYIEGSLQGLRLEDAGYEIGSFYSLQYDDVKCQLLLSSSDQGSNKVCRKKVGDHFYPLIDIVNQKLSVMFEGVERVQVRYSYPTLKTPVE